MFIVKFLLYHFAFEHFLAYLDGKGSVEFGELCLDESHADALIDAEAMIARRYFTHYFALGVEDCVAVTRNCFVCKFDADELLSNAVGLLLDEGFLTDELFFIQLSEHRKTSHNRRNVCAEFVAVEGQPDFEAKRVAAT